MTFVFIFLFSKQLNFEVHKNPNLGFSIGGGINSGLNPFDPKDKRVSSNKVHSNFKQSPTRKMAEFALISF